MAKIAPSPRAAFTTNTGAPLVGGKLFTYAAGTSTPQQTFTDAAGTVPNTNPIILDARGEATIFWSGVYKVVLQDSAGATLWTQDNFDPQDTAAIYSDFASVASAAKGAGLVGFAGAQAYAAATVGGRLLDMGADPRSFGGVGDGAADDTAAIVAALAASKTLDLRNRSWKITSTVTLPAGTIVNMQGANIIAACGATPVFQFLNGNAGLTILHGGGAVTGTASSFLFAQGTTNQPTAISMYASQIHVESLLISSTTITTAFVFDKAVNSVYLHGLNLFTPNGISASGKCVAIMLSDSILFSATGAAGTAGIKLRSTGGTIHYNEGWQIVNCTIDNYEISHDITDIFAYQITGGYHGVNGALSATTGYAFQLQAPSTNLCEEFTVGGGCVIGGRVRFAASAGGQAYYSTIDATFINTPGTSIALENNACNVTIRGKWKGGSGTAIGVVGTTNNVAIIASGDFDSTYTNGVVLNGANGANCVIGPLSGPTIGDIVGAGRGNIIYQGIPLHNNAVRALVRQPSGANITGAFIVGAAIATLPVAFARGEKGSVIVNLSYSGATAATSNVQVLGPAGMVFDSGTGYSASNLYLGATSGLLHARLDYTCSADGSGNVTVSNQAGSTLTINNQGYCAVVKSA
jgi:hypothetical protein